MFCAIAPRAADHQPILLAALWFETRGTALLTMRVSNLVLRSALHLSKPSDCEAVADGANKARVSKDEARFSKVLRIATQRF